MTILTSLILVVAIFLIALFIAYYVQKGTPTTQEMNDKITENLMQESQEKLIDNELEEVSKPKNKRKYYPKKPNTKL